MRIRIHLVLFLLISFFSCEKSENPIIPDPIVEDPKDDPVVEDETAPTITTTGFNDIIETYAEISISIVDESTVETKVMNNGEELASSAEKQFDVSINPYGIPVGATDFIVVSTDAKGNETSETFSVEIKHLLVTYEFAQHEQIDDRQNWIFFNSTDGTELAANKVEIGLQKIYTDELIVDEKVLFTKALSQIFNEGNYKNLILSTYEVPLGDVRLPGPEYNYYQLESTVDVTLNGIPFVNGLPHYTSYGRFSHTSTFSGDETSTNLEILHYGNKPAFIRTNSWGSSPAFDGKKENYLYTMITPEEGNTTMTLESDTLVPAANNVKIDIPMHDSGTLFISRRGFESEEDLIAFNSHELFDVSDSNGTQIDYVDLPVLNEIEFYDTNIQYSVDGKSFYSRGSDATLEVDAPNWIANVEQVNDTLHRLSANNAAVDYYQIGFSKNENSDDFLKTYSMSWSHYLDENENGIKDFSLISLPQLISEAFEEPFFKTTDDLSTTGVSAVGYQEYASYDELIANFAYNQNVRPFADNAFKRIFFRNQEASGKSNSTKPFWDLNDHHQLDPTTNRNRIDYSKKQY